jgi:hypothetical protein
MFHTSTLFVVADPDRLLDAFGCALANICYVRMRALMVTGFVYIGVPLE